jgi:cell division septation protein DedD
VSVGAAYAWQPRPPAPPVAQASSVAPMEQPATAPTVAAAEPIASPAVSPSIEAQDPKPIATTGGPSKSYSVLVASFRKPSQADVLVSELRDLGYQASIARAQGLTNGLWHQVMAGPFGDLGAARETESRLRQLPGYADAHLIRN